MFLTGWFRKKSRSEWPGLNREAEFGFFRITLGLSLVFCIMKVVHLTGCISMVTCAVERLQFGDERVEITVRWPIDSPLDLCLEEQEGLRCFNII